MKSVLCALAAELSEEETAFLACEAANDEQARRLGRLAVENGLRTLAH